MNKEKLATKVMTICNFMKKNQPLNEGHIQLKEEQLASLQEK